jgi:4-amino-4-deoxy-L-arabinose transferase-like glycosyltransferase
LFLVIIVNVTLASRYYTNDPKLSGDSALYYETATTIAQGKIWIEQYNSDIGAIMAPGYSFLLAGMFLLFGQKIVCAYLLNIILHIISAMLMFYLSSKFFNRTIAWWFSIWLLLYYQIWRMNFIVMMEIPTIFFIEITFFFLYKYHQTRLTKNLILFSILAGLLVFINNRFIFHFLILITITLTYATFGRVYKMRDAFILGFGILLVLLPWHIRQYIHYDRLLIFAPARTEMISYYRSDDDIGYTEIKSYEEQLEQFENRSGMTVARLESIKKDFTERKYLDMVSEYKQKNSRPYYKYLSRLKGFWNIWQFDFSWNYGDDTRIIPPARKSANLLNITFLTPMFLFFAVGVFYAVIKRQVFIQMLSIFVFSHWILHILVHYISRYRITILPTIFFIAWYGIYELSKIQKIESLLQNVSSTLRAKKKKLVYIIQLQIK